jgi:hypothetical protein
MRLELPSAAPRCGALRYYCGDVAFGVVVWRRAVVRCDAAQSKQMCGCTPGCLQKKVMQSEAACTVLQPLIAANSQFIS